MRRLLLIEANDDTRWVGSRVGPKVHVLPIALLGLASCARLAAPEVELRVIETSLHARSDEDLAAIIAEFAPTWIGIRSISLFSEEVKRVVRVARTHSGAPVILGGPIATALKEKVFELAPELEYAAVGEGETVITALVQGVPCAEIPGMISRRALTPRINPPAQAPPKLDELPMADHTLVSLAEYEQHLSYAYNHRRQGLLITSRGCPYRCTYCFQISEQPVRLQSAERVVSDIRALVEQHDVHDFYIVDDVFNLHRKRALDIFARLEAAKLDAKLYFVNGLRVDLCDEAFVDRMVAAGTVWVTFAIETAHPRVQELIRKKLDLTQAHRIISHAQSHDIVVNVNTMYGFPTETAAEAQVTLEWLGTLPRPSLLPYHFNLRGYPGCEIVEQAADAGWSRDSFLATGNSAYGDLPSGSPTFTRHEMMKHMLEFHERFGLANQDHLTRALATLRHIGYTDHDLCDMYTVLMNRSIGAVSEIIQANRTGS